MDAIQLFVPTFRIEECLAEVRECLEKGWTGIGFKTIAFETAWNEYTGLPHAHFLNSATAGLHLAMRLLKQRHEWADGDEVITTPLTFVSTNHAILYENLNPVFADVDEYLCLDPRTNHRQDQGHCFCGSRGQYRTAPGRRADCPGVWTEVDTRRRAHDRHAVSWPARRP
jgi:hypothetical protein